MAAPKQKPPTQTELALMEAQNLVQMWLRTKSYLLKAGTNDPITRDEEQDFLQTKSDISKYQRTLGSKLPQGITFAADRLQDLLRQCISVAHVRGLPRTDREILINNWHLVFIHLSRVVGAMQFINEGYVYVPRAKKGSGSNLSDLKKAASNDKGAKGNFLKSGKFWVTLIVLAVAALVVYSQTQ